MELCHVKRYWVTQLELVFTSNEDATISLAVAPVIKTEQAKGIFIMNVEGIFPNKPNEKVRAFTFASTSS